MANKPDYSIASNCLSTFREKREEYISGEWFSCFRFFRSSVLQGTETLAFILKHAAKHDSRSRNVFIELGWMEEDGTLTKMAPPPVIEIVKNNYIEKTPDINPVIDFITPSKPKPQLTEIEVLNKNLKKQWEDKTTEAIQYCNIIRSKITCTKEYYAVERPLLNMLNNNIHSAENINRSIDNFKNYIQTFTNNIITELLKILGELKNIKQTYKDNADQLDTLNNELLKKEAANIRRQNERLEFSNAIAKGQLITVSTQRINELYPDENERIKILRQCEKLGVETFDASDQEEREKAIREQRLYNSFNI